MILCVTARGRGLDALVEPRFGRAPFFLLLDPDGTVLTPVENPYMDTRGGVGPRAVQILADHHVETLITGQMGANALAAVKAAGIRVYACPEGESVSGALQLFRSGELQQIA
jgi:predicted Fe-Mo cluster-binding NifX family protein